ncbi:MAG: hypothetical protein PHS14_13285, partial [Elusimicrobia bacterium]|nr:hypothetical protein [Elusimicrobiota bacterium]
ASGEDFDWGLRVHAKGYRLVYADEALVAHPAACSIRALCRKTARIRDGLRRLRAQRGPASASASEAIKTLVDPGVVCARIMGESRIKTLRQKAGVCAVALFVHYASYWSET